jgi:hypothetical protein
MLWMCAIISIPCFVLSYFANASGLEQLGIALLYIGGAPVLATIFGFFYFVVFCPEKLQSEEYQLRHETLELIKQKGSSIEVSPSSLEGISNPVISGGGRKR